MPISHSNATAIPSYLRINRRCLLLLVVLLSLALALALLLGAGSAQAAATNGLPGIACPSASLCVAVDEGGRVVTSTNPSGGEGAWSAPEGVDPGHRLEAIACPAASLCVAVDNAGNVVTSTDPTGGTGAWTLTRVDPALEPRNLGERQAVIACPSTALCVVVDGNNNLITTTNPTGGAGAWTLDHASGSVLNVERGLVACASAALCVTSSDGAEEPQWLFSTTNPTVGWEAWKSTGRDELARFRGVIAGACPSEALCVLGDGEGNILTSTTPATGPWTATYMEGNYEFAIEGMACPSTTLCVAADRNGDILTSTNPTGGRAAWETAEIPDGHEMAVSCASTTFCAVTNAQGNVWTSTEPTSGEPAWHHAHIDSGTEEPPNEEPKKEEPKPKEEPHYEEHPGGGDNLKIASCCDGSVSVTPAQIKALLTRQLIPSGKAAKISSLLKHGGLTMNVSALEAGTLLVQWYEVPKGATLARQTKAKPVLVAAGQATFGGAGSGKVRIRLTAEGTKLLRHGGRLKLEAMGSFRPAGGGASVVATGAVGVRR